MIRHLVTFTRSPGAAPETIILDRARRVPLTRGGILRILREANPAAVFVSVAVVPLVVPRKKQVPRNPDGPRRKCLRVRPTVHLSLSRQSRAAGVPIAIQLERLILAGETSANA